MHRIRKLFDDDKQLLPRGEIPAIVNPQYAMADTAKISNRGCVFDRDLGAFPGDDHDCGYVLEGFNTF